MNILFATLKKIKGGIHPTFPFFENAAPLKSVEAKDPLGKLLLKTELICVVSFIIFTPSCMKFMEPKIGQKSALISVCTLFDCKMYLFKSKLRLFPHWLNVGKSKQKNWRAYWSWLLSVSFTGLDFRFTIHIRLKITLILWSGYLFTGQNVVAWAAALLC